MEKNVRTIRVAVDLVPLRPGGENGGAKTLVTTLLRAFATCKGEAFDFLLITAPWNHDELQQYAAANMECQTKAQVYRLTRLDRLLTRWVPWVAGKLEPRMQAVPRRTLRRWLLGRLVAFNVLVQQWFQEERACVLKRRHSVALLFCPFTAPTLAEPHLPVVSVVHDLQHIDMPFLFSVAEVQQRNQFLFDLCETAKHIICVSEFTRSTLIKYFTVLHDNVHVIPNCIHERLVPLAEHDVICRLQAHGLTRDSYLFYPANFWPHKNHKMLLIAYALYCRRHPDDALDLVFTGALQDKQAELECAAVQMGCADHIRFAGFLTAEDLTTIWQGCRGLIFPSMYEGFGIPLLEAMRFNKPAACSDVTSLPEVGGAAVLYFDPRKPDNMADAIERLAHDDALVGELVSRGRLRLESYSPLRMVTDYLEQFRAAAAAGDAGDVYVVDI